MLLVMEELAAEVLTYHFSGPIYPTSLAKDPRYELSIMNRKKYSKTNIVA